MNWVAFACAFAGVETGTREESDGVSSDRGSSTAGTYPSFLVNGPSWNGTPESSAYKSEKQQAEARLAPAECSPELDPSLSQRGWSGTGRHAIAHVRTDRILVDQHALILIAAVQVDKHQTRSLPAMSDHVRRSIIAILVLGTVMSLVMAFVPDVLWSALARLM